MLTTRSLSISLLAGLGALTAQAPATTDEAPTVCVYLLAGQSNMEGQAVVGLDHEQYYNGGRGNLEEVLSREEEGRRFAHLRDERGAWTKRDDVFVWYRKAGKQLKAGPLEIGYAVYDDPHHFGPELQFGHVVGEQTEAPVLLVKTCWGGKSLFRDFRPPSAEGDTGPYYTQMIAEYKEAIGELGERFPQLKGHAPVLRGFVWFQGWNDMCDATGREQYAQNLELLIRDVRKDLGAPSLPVVVGETGNADHEGFRRSQRAGTEHEDFRGNVTFVPTRAFLRKPEDSPNVTHGHHWFGNAESYLLVGDALGRAALALQASRR